MAEAVRLAGRCLWADDLMRALLVFGDDERDALDLALKAPDIHGVLRYLDEWLRSQVKYGSDDLTDAEVAAYSRVRDKLYEFTHEAGVEL